MRALLYRHLEPEGRPEPGLSPLNTLIALLILLAVITVIAETEATLTGVHAALFSRLELFFGTVFTLEYLARVHAAGEDPRYRGLVGRLRYMVSIWALIDLVALLPFYFGILGTSNAFFLRLIRLLRLLRLSRLGRFSKAWDALADALHTRMHELMLSVGLALVLLVLSSACIYLVEAEQQPESFGSIPRALWWSIATLTTVGYGDVTPITTIGRIFAGVTAVAGIGLIAMPTGILAAAFSDAFQKRREQEQDHG
ncbi:ion transporter [Natronospirillum operosum]|uniref:Ion transporter n=1 Tax=Natronospirillum operosum TaxID=2759953 RepID=A0A4Z0WCS9_9GAMM|nr:potassium channel family protein [Natronospirillum operosum]TGG92800.1 ion transporter [Natronospirillum operosum]